MTSEEKIDVVNRQLQAAKVNIIEEALALAAALESVAKSIRAAGDDLARLSWATSRFDTKLHGRICELHLFEHLFNSMKDR